MATPLLDENGHVKCSVRVAAVSEAMPFHDHAADGVDLGAIREMTAKVMCERPDFVCYPEICASCGAEKQQTIDAAPEMEPFAAAVGEIAREFGVALIVPLLERDGDRVYNSVPIVDRSGRLVAVYRKNYPTVWELEAGISPGNEIAVAVCDGVRVGAAVCFDANFDTMADRLSQRAARLVFWPSMYWGGQILQHWTLRYGFAIAAVYWRESSIIDMNGRYLTKQGHDTLQVQSGHLPPWAVADIQINRELYHLDLNQQHFPAIREKYTPDVEIEVWEPEGYFLMASRRPDLPVEVVAEEFGLETARDYLARSVKARDEVLAALEK
jgi:predicted amidohydrolase